MDTAEDDDILVGARRLHRQAEGIACDVGHFLDLIALVIMGQQQRVALFGQTTNLFFDLFLFHCLPFRGCRSVAVY